MKRFAISLAVVVIVIIPAVAVFYSERVQATYPHGADLFNLGFEYTANAVPKGWLYSNSEHYTISLDSTIKRSGQYSVVIRYHGGKPSFQPL